jgi:hypothetical protein
LAITCVSNVWMSNERPFYTSTFQELSNDIKNVTSHWVLTPEIVFWNFGSPLGLHLPKWELPWECECSLPHTFLHSREYVMWLAGFLLARTFATSLLLTLELTLGSQPCNPFALVTSLKLGLRQIVSWV